jgi:hypothetical protein
MHSFANTAELTPLVVVKPKPLLETPQLAKFGSRWVI